MPVLGNATMLIKQAIALLRAVDVGRAIAWCRETLGFEAEPFPSKQPYEFCYGYKTRLKLWRRDTRLSRVKRAP